MNLRNSVPHGAHSAADHALITPRAAGTTVKPTHTIVQASDGIHVKPLHETANPVSNTAALAVDG